MTTQSNSAPSEAARYGRGTDLRLCAKFIIASRRRVSETNPAMGQVIYLASNPKICSQWHDYGDRNPVLSPIITRLGMILLDLFPSWCNVSSTVRTNRCIAINLGPAELANLEGPARRAGNAINKISANTGAIIRARKNQPKGLLERRDFTAMPVAMAKPNQTIAIMICMRPTKRFIRYRWRLCILLS